MKTRKIIALVLLLGDGGGDPERMPRNFGSERIQRRIYQRDSAVFGRDEEN